MHCVDLVESFQTHIYLQNFALIQPRTSPVKSARSSGAAAEPRTAPKSGATYAILAQSAGAAPPPLDFKQLAAAAAATGNDTPLRM